MIISTFIIYSPNAFLRRDLVYQVKPSDQSHIDFLDGLLKSDDRVSCHGDDV